MDCQPLNTPVSSKKCKKNPHFSWTIQLNKKVQRLGVKITVHWRNVRLKQKHKHWWLTLHMKAEQRKIQFVLTLKTKQKQLHVAHSQAQLELQHIIPSGLKVEWPLSWLITLADLSADERPGWIPAVTIPHIRMTVLEAYLFRLHDLWLIQAFNKVYQKARVIFILFMCCCDELQRWHECGGGTMWIQLQCHQFHGQKQTTGLNMANNGIQVKIGNFEEHRKLQINARDSSTSTLFCTQPI